VPRRRFGERRYFEKVRSVSCAHDTTVEQGSHSAGCFQIRDRPACAAGSEVFAQMQPRKHMSL